MSRLNFHRIDSPRLGAPGIAVAGPWLLNSPLLGVLLEPTFERLQAVWVASAPDSERAVDLVGRFGTAAHATALGGLRQGPREASARAALETLRLRYPALDDGGHLAMTGDADAGQLAVSEAAGALSE